MHAIAVKKVRGEYEWNVASIVRLQTKPNQTN